MRKNIKFILCFILVFSFIFTMPSVAFAVENEPDIENELMTCERYNAISIGSIGSSVNLKDYIPDLVAFKNDVLHQFMVDDSNLTDPDGYGYLDLSKYKLPVNADLYSSICEFIWYESPELFRSTGFMAELGGKNDSYIIGLNCSYIYDKPEDFVNDYNKAIKKADELLYGIEGNDSLNDVEKALLLHDRLALFCEYDVVNLDNDTLPDSVFNMYGVLGEGIAVCMGYALAYDYLLERVGIDSQYCSSQRMNHAWNVVYIDNEPYHVDVTWDDPTDDISGQVFHDNFLRSTEGIKETGHKYGVFDRTDYITTPKSTKYDNYFWQDSMTSFQLVNNKIYYIDSDYNTQSSTKRTGKLIELDDINDTTPVILKEITDEWKKVEDDTIWKYNFSKLVSGNGILYYSDTDTVYSFNPVTNEEKIIVTPEEKAKVTGNNTDYAIYGMRFDGCTLKGEYSKTPNYETTTKTEKVFSKDIHVKDNKWVSLVSSTETKKGKEAITCVNCDYVFEQRETAALGNHNWGDWYYDTSAKPSCTSDGIRVKSCKDSGCTATKWEKVKATGHNYSGEWTVDISANCTNIGIKSHHCTKCDSRKDVTKIPVNNTHIAGGTWLIGKEATCNSEGYKYKTCTICGDEAERTVIPKKEHKLKSINQRTVTCTVDGYTGDKKCSSCGTVVETGTVVKATGHKPGNWIIERQPTETTDGYKYKECTVCYEKVEEDVIKYVTLLATPAVKVANTAKGIKVTWNKIENAESYIIYRRTYNESTKKWSGWSKLKVDCTGTSYTDAKVKLGTKYRYTVRAVNGNVMSAYTSTSTLKYNVTPTVKVSNASSGITVSWSTAANATGYTVYRSEYNTKTKKWTSWKNMGTAKANKTSWTDKKVKSGVKYKYTVRACNDSVKSSYKASANILYLAQPTVTVKAVSNGVNVNWTQCAGSKGYTVYRAEYNTTTKQWSSWKNMGTAKKEKKAWVDKSAKKGVTYRYTVRAVNGDYRSSYKASNNVKR